MSKIRERFGIRGRLRGQVKRAVAIVLAAVTALTACGITGFAADSGHKVTVFHGYGTEAAKYSIADNPFVLDTLDYEAYQKSALTGQTNGDFKDSNPIGGSGALLKFNPPARISGVDIVYGDLKGSFSTGLSGSVLKVKDDGTGLELVKKPTSSGEVTDKMILTFGSYWNTQSAAVSMLRFYNIKEDLTVIYRYADEVTFKVGAGEGKAEVTDFPGYADTSDGVTGYSRARTREDEGALNPFVTSVTAPKGQVIDSYAVSIGDKNVNVTSDQVKKGVYIDASGKITEGDVNAVLKIENDKITTYDLGQSINVTPSYKSGDTKYTIKVNGAAVDRDGANGKWKAGDFSVSTDLKNYVQNRGGDYDPAKGVAHLIDDYSDPSGTGLAFWFFGSYGEVTSIDLEIGGKKYTFSGDNLDITSGAVFLTKGNKLEKRDNTAYKNGDIIRFRHNAGQGDDAYAMYFIEIHSDITVTVNYKNVTAEVSDPQGALDSIEFDQTPSDGDGGNIVQGAAGKDFSVPGGYLRGADPYSYRLRFKTADGAVITGLKFTDGGSWTKNVTEEEITGKTVTCENDAKTLKFAALAHEDGWHFVKVYLQKTDKFTVEPIVESVLHTKESVKVTLEASPDLAVGVNANGTKGKSGTVSEDNLSVTVPKGALSYDTNQNYFQWGLGSTLDNEMEYAGVDIYRVLDDGSEKLIRSLGEGILSRDAIRAQGDSLTTSPEDNFGTNDPIKVRLTKNRSGVATLAFYITNGNSDFLLKLKYKDYTDDGEEKVGKDAKFDANQTIKVDAPHSSWKAVKFVKYMKTAGSVVSFEGKYLNNTNVAAPDGSYGVIRFDISEKTGYQITGFKLSDADGKVAAVNFDIAQTGNSKVSADLVTAEWSYTQGVYHVAVYWQKVRGMVLKVETKKLTGSNFTVTFEPLADGNISKFYSFEGNKIKGVTTDASFSRIGIEKAGTLTANKSGSRIQWQGEITYGSGWEYSKLEVINTDTGKVAATLLSGAKTYLSAKPANQSGSYTSAGITVNYSKRLCGDFVIQVWGVSGNYTLRLYYKNYDSGQELPGKDASVNVPWGGVVTANKSNVSVRRVVNNKFDDKAPNSERYNERLAKNVFKADLNVKTPGDRVESVTVDANGRTYTMGAKLLAGYSGAESQRVLGAQIEVAKRGNGRMRVHVWDLVGTVTVTANLSSGHKYKVSLDEGDRGVFRVLEIPKTGCAYDQSMKNITVMQGTTASSTSGAGESICYAFCADVGYEIDKLIITSNGETYTFDFRSQVPNGKNSYSVYKPYLTVTYAIFQNIGGETMRLRLHNIDADAQIKVTYREDVYTVTAYPQYGKGWLRADLYEDAAVYTELSDNKAVAKVVSGTMNWRTHGIKYHFKPMNEGSVVTHVLVRNHIGNYVIMGDGVGLKESKWYRINGCIAGYYLADEGVAEVRVYGLYRDIDVIAFYDDEPVDPNIVIPSDIATHDLGVYPMGSDEGYVDEAVTKPRVLGKSKAEPEKKFNILPVILGCAGALIVAAGIIIPIIIVKRRKREEV